MKHINLENLANGAFTAQVNRGPAFKLVEADGDLWKNGIMKKIKEYLEYELSEELEEYHITVIA